MNGDREIIQVHITGTVQQTIEIVDTTYGDMADIIEMLNAGELHTTIEHYGASTVKGVAIEDENGFLVARITNQTNLLADGLFNNFTYIGIQDADS